MDPLHVLNAKPTTQYVSTGDENDLLKIRCTQKGELKVLLPPGSLLTVHSYVEMLEHQQAQLVLGLQELYRRLQGGEARDGGKLPEISCETPTTHDLLEWLGALHHDEHDGPDKFYDDPYMMQAVAILENSGPTTRDLSLGSTQSEIDPVTPLEAELVDMTLHPTTPRAAYTSQALFVDSSQLFVEEINTQPIDLTAEPVPYFSQISWQPRNADIYSAGFEVYDDWNYDTNAEAAGIAEASGVQQPANISVNPSLTLRDWSELYSYNFDKGFIHT